MGIFWVTLMRHRYMPYPTYDIHVSNSILSAVYLNLVANLILYKINVENFMKYCEVFEINCLSSNLSCWQYDCELNGRIRTPMPSNAELMGRPPARPVPKPVAKPSGASQSASQAANSITSSTRTRVDRSMLRRVNSNSNNNTAGSRANPTAGQNGATRTNTRNRGWVYNLE